MLHIYSCIVHEHDLRFVLAAGVICLLAALSAFSIFERARCATRRKLAWLALAGFVAGIGIWSTHFIAMLAYEADIPIGYDVPLTALSVAAAVLITGSGWWAAGKMARAGPFIGGTLIGASIATMHYIGMFAVKMGGWIVWDQAYVVASVLIGIALSVAALAEHRRKPQAVPWRPALLFTLAICGLHFTAMAAVGVYPDPNMEVPAAAIGNGSLSIIVAAMALIILTISLALVVLDRRLARNALEEAQRLRTFADAAVEGLVVIDGHEIIDANRSFLMLAGYASFDQLPRRLAELFPDLALERLAGAEGTTAEETRLACATGTSCDVELLCRPLRWQHSDLRVLAVRDMTERKVAAARIAHLAYHDPLTGVPNRAVFNDRLAQATISAGSNDHVVSVTCIDLDGFKAVNDLHGHPAGDELLIAVASRLRSIVHENDLLARLGGDEFAIIQEGGTQPDEAGALAERILSVFGKPFAVAEEMIRVTASVGIAIYPTDAANPADLVKNADMALYRSKAEGEGLVRFYEAAMDEALRRRRQLSADLRVAAERNELAVHYQPLADLGTGEIVGFEALLRWTHPEHGPIGPAAFIPMAEESGSILQLGDWVMREAVREAAAWEPRLRLAINISPIQFVDDEFVSKIEKTLGDAGFDPARLDLEITEGLLIKDADSALRTLRQLKALGVQISMDDFGTGYSSLSYFRMFPFDKVKIDQSFVQDMLTNPQSRAIIRSVIGLGRGLGVPVVAEGVETAEQLDALRAEGCDQVQGYLLSRPNPIAYFAGVVLAKECDVTPRRKATS